MFIGLCIVYALIGFLAAMKTLSGSRLNQPLLAMERPFVFIIYMLFLWPWHFLANRSK